MAAGIATEKEWRVGEQVRVRGARWTIRAADPWPDCTVLRLASVSSPPKPRTILSPFDRPARLHIQPSARHLKPRRWLHVVRRLAASLVPFGGTRMSPASSLRLMPHQFEPLLAATRYGATRILIADDVGLGKTVQAGLLLAEMAGERSGFRALVLVPASLRDQWAHELESHFSISVTAADAAWLRYTAREWPAHVNPWAMPGIYIASIDFLKRAE